MTDEHNSSQTWRDANAEASAAGGTAEPLSASDALAGMSGLNTAARSAELLPDSDALAGLPGARWFDYVRHLVPTGQTPWVWIAPDTDDAPAMVGWGERARFLARGHSSVSHAWQQFRQWAANRGESGALAFGSFPFSPDQDGFLVVPQVLILRRHLGDPTWVLGASAKSLNTLGGNLSLSWDSVAHSSTEQTEYDTKADVSQDQWRTQVHKTVHAFGDSPLEKVVLARAVTASTVHPFLQFSQLDTAASLAQRFPGCWLYADDGLVGASPELLVDCRDGLFRCRVLAGTRKPAWVHELFEDPKERHEHELAVASVTGRLAEAGLTRPTVRGPYLLELPNVTHLATDITALVGNSDAARIVDAIHPTAAVCGTPREPAFNHITRTETIDRGRFAGPVGWMSANGSGQWALALRCGQFAPGNRSVRVFAGAGIMPSSDPEKEWTETGAKMEAFLSGLR